MLISENEQNHSFLHQNEFALLKNLADIAAEDIINFSLFYTTFLMNFSMNSKNADILLAMKFLMRLREIIDKVDENCHCYIQTFINHIIR